MSNAGIDNWKRDWPVKERALAILKQLVCACPHVKAQGAGFEVPDDFWTAHAEAQRLLAEVDGK